VIGTLTSVARSSGVSVEVVIVDDGSTDDSATRLCTWLDDNPSVSAALVRHSVNRGLGAARNTALDLARGRFFLVLDAGNELAPGGLAALADAFDEPDVALAYGVLECFDASGPIELGNTLPFEPPRLAAGSGAVDATMLIRTRALRAVAGFTTDPRLHGWEHYDVWCALAERGGRAAFVPSIVGRTRISPTSPRALTDLTRDDALALLRERHPRAMAREAVHA
jgi:glycosyltransferase involved in cell wall biosynthesis